MSYLSIQQVLLFASLTGIGLLLSALLFQWSRRPIRQSGNRLRRAPLFCKAFVLTGLIIGIVHGSTKNESQGGSDQSGQARRRAQTMTRQETATTQQTVQPWAIRGAYEDWIHLELPEEFSFPFGLERLTNVVLMANGAVRTKTFADLATLPSPLSLEPGVSSVTHGLTTSNTYAIAWHNALVNREATNRIDAVLELSPDGSVATRFGSLTQHIPPQLPEGYVGSGQDAAWISRNFELLQAMDPSLTNSTQILDIGYETWLRNWVGINEMNGRYQSAITIDDLPDGPCYLECGPWKMILTSPGTYRFPLQVYEPYRTQTYPAGIPFQTTYDDGYRGFEESFTIRDLDDPLYPHTPSARSSLAHPSRAATNWGDRDVHTFRILEPVVIVNPKNLPLNEAQQAEIRIWCNLPSRDRIFDSVIEGLRMLFNLEGDAEILDIHCDGIIRLGCIHGINTSWGTLTISEINSIPFPGTAPYSRSDEPIFYGETLHIQETNNLSIVHLTAQTATNSLDVVRESTTVDIPAGSTCYVAVYLGTAEDACNPINCLDDAVSWRVTATSQPDFTGKTSVFEHRDELQATDGTYDIQYGIMLNPIKLASHIYHASAHEPLHLSIEAMAQHAVDTKRATCIQVVVYPVTDDGIIGLPDWVDL